MFTLKPNTATARDRNSTCWMFAIQPDMPHWRWLLELWFMCFLRDTMWRMLKRQRNVSSSIVGCRILFWPPLWENQQNCLRWRLSESMDQRLAVTCWMVLWSCLLRRSLFRKCSALSLLILRTEGSVYYFTWTNTNCCFCRKPSLMFAYLASFFL